ncbi:hypothetical protein N836_04135 [Leptolyngbya sp. Heron Island J]|nr:hypothetical protein N836_04135 [Leptolyngbya sp. Heron Island J]
MLDKSGCYALLFEGLLLSCDCSFTYLRGETPLSAIIASR